MGYCNYPHCSDPHCVGAGESGIYPAVIRIKEEYTKKIKSIHVTRSEYAEAERDRNSKGLSKKIEEILAQKHGGHILTQG